MFSLVGADACDIVANELGVRTIVDLRTADELTQHPLPMVYQRHPAVRHSHIPFFEGHEFAALSLPGGYEPQRWTVRYTAYAEYAGRFATVRVLDEILEDNASPTVFHCWSGKDRTGMIAAFVLDLLGVSDEDIEADYEQSMHWWLIHLAHDELSEGEPPDSYRTVPAVIQRALDNLRHNHGSIEQMLLDSGMNPEIPRRLRDALLT
jgi:protein-tyrosine phosphatase